MAGSKEKGGDSGMIAAKVEMPPDEFRRILSDAWRSEITEELWRRIKGMIPGGGLISVGALTAVGGIIWGLLVGTVQTQVTSATSSAVASLQPEIQRMARLEATEAVKADIANVDAVRARVRESVREMMAQALTDPAIVAEIEKHARAAAAGQIGDARWRRDIERSVMQQQAGDANLAPLLRLFALTDLLRDGPGQAEAVRILADSALRVPAAGLASDHPDARFVGQGVATYVQHLVRQAEAGAPEADGFPANQILLFRLAEKVAEPIPPGNAFEALMHRFDSPAALRWLVGRARGSVGAPRALALQALLTHPATEARERFVALLCAGDPQIRPDVLRAAAARPDALAGDAEGQQFAYLVRCAEDVLEARRVPRADVGCLPGGDLLVPWQLSRIPVGSERGAEGLRERRDQLDSQLRRVAPNCEAALPLAEAGPALRTPLGWSTLGEAVRAGPAAPLAGLGGLLPPGAEGAPPAWLAALAAGTGPMTAILAAPDRHAAHVSLLVERLSSLPEETEGVGTARTRLAGVLAQAPLLPGRPAERLLLEAMAAGGKPVCEAALNTFAVSVGAAARAPAALAESLACLRDGRSLPTAQQPAVLAAMVTSAGTTPADRAAARRTFFALAVGLNLASAEARAPAALLDWVLRLPAEADAQQVAQALQAILAVDGQAAATALERPATSRETLERVRGLLADRPRAYAPLVVAAPYLDQGFVARLAAADGPVEAGGRFWRSLVVPTPSSFTLGADHAAVLLRAQPLAALPLDEDGDTTRLPAGTYLLGAPQAATLGRLARRPDVPETSGQLALGTAVPLPAGTARYSRLGPDGPRHYPLQLEAGRAYEIRTMRLEGALDTVITLLDARGTEVPGASNDDENRTVLASRICVNPPAAGLYWLRVENYNGPPREPLGFEFLATEAPCQPTR
jgi:hypothetical protein